MKNASQSNLASSKTHSTSGQPLQSRAQRLVQVLEPGVRTRLSDLKSLARVTALPELLRRHGLIQTLLFIKRKGAEGSAEQSTGRSAGRSTGRSAELLLWDFLEAGVAELVPGVPLTLEGLKDAPPGELMMLEAVAEEVAVLIADLVAALSLDTASGPSDSTSSEEVSP